MTLLLLGLFFNTVIELLELTLFLLEEETKVKYVIT